MSNYPDYDSPEIKFWCNVRSSQDGCWLWCASKDNRIGGEYGFLHFGGKSWRAHRFSWRIHHGEIPDGLFVCHQCDNPPCVRPSHLFLGTNRDNILDAQKKGRLKVPISDACNMQGEKNGQSKLTASEVLLIRQLRDAGQSMPNLAKQFGISLTQISYIVNRKKWKHL